MASETTEKSMKPLANVKRAKLSKYRQDASFQGVKPVQ